MADYDFGGWATKNNLKCADGRIIRPGAFKHMDGVTVPLCWQHGHSSTTNVLGKVLLENRGDDGVYGYARFNDTSAANDAKKLVLHGDVNKLSIYANNLQETGKNVTHGNIREVSLVLFGSNPGAVIDNITIAHGEFTDILDDEAYIRMDIPIELAHSDISDDSGDRTADEILESMTELQKNAAFMMFAKAVAHDDSDDDLVLKHEDGDISVKDVFDSMTEEQQNVVYYMLSQALQHSDDDDSADAADSEDDADDSVQHSDTDNTDESTDQKGPLVANVFEDQGEKSQVATLSHSDIKGIIENGRKLGSLKESMEDYVLKHGIENIDILFPDAKAVTDTPDFVKRRTEWVADVIGGTKHTPFSRIKSLTADITPDEARAKGYIKGNMKKEEFFSVAKRVTTPQTVYKKQKLDRDDILDITDFDVVVWLKAEMRVLLDEEIARAILIGDGRSNADDDKIKEDHVRPIATDAELYVTTVYVNINDANSSYEEVVDALTLQRRHYRGSGNPTFYTSESVLAQMLLIKDTLGRRIYPTINDLAAALRVRNIIAVEVFENQGDLVGILVNLMDYTVGSDKGGAVSMFDDFDIDYNQHKYLTEVRISGALTKYKSAIVVRKVVGTAVLVTAVPPTFADNTVTVPTVTGVTYKNKLTNATLTTGSPVVLAAGESLTVIAIPSSASYYFASNADDEWVYEGE